MLERSEAQLILLTHLKRVVREKVGPALQKPTRAVILTGKSSPFSGTWGF